MRNFLSRFVGSDLFDADRPAKEIYQQAKIKQFMSGTLNAASVRPHHVALEFITAVFPPREIKRKLL